jgi:hypothetical protein
MLIPEDVYDNKNVEGMHVDLPNANGHMVPDGPQQGDRAHPIEGSTKPDSALRLHRRDQEPLKSLDNDPNNTPPSPCLHADTTDHELGVTVAD